MLAAAAPGSAGTQRRGGGGGGHARQRGLGGGGGAAALVPASAMGLPPGVDPLTLDPDEAFVRFGVREVQTIEQSLSTSCDTLTARLRLLVSERYRDMLGTANTLIDMSASSTNLVQQLDRLSADVSAAERNVDVSSAFGLCGTDASSSDAKAERGVGGQGGAQKQAQQDLCAVAACTKLIAEAPDEVWRAIEASNKGDRSSSDHTRRSLQAATIMRASYIYVLANEAWSWLIDDRNQRDSLTKRLQPLGGNVDIPTLFPYIARQHSALQPMRTFLEQGALAGLSHPLTADASLHQGASIYQSTITNLASLALLDNFSLTRSRQELLRSRSEMLRAYVESHDERHSSSRASILVGILTHVSNTLLHLVKAFALPSSAAAASTDAVDCHLQEVYSRLSSGRSDVDGPSTFPPTPMSALRTLPSAKTYADHLPNRVLFFARPLSDDTREEKAGEDILSVLQGWSSEVFENILSDPLPKIVEDLSTIARIGEVQSDVWSTLERCVGNAHRVCKAQGERFAVAIEKQLRLLVKRMDDLLLVRLRGICRLQGDELSRIVIKSMQDTFEALCDESIEARSESDPIRYVFSVDKSAPKHDLSEGVDGLALKLQMRTDKVQSILSKAEERATALVFETQAYMEAIERVQMKLDPKQSARSTLTSRLSADGEGQMSGIEAAKQVLAGLQSTVQQAKASIATALEQMASRCSEQGSGNVRGSANSLFLIRLVSALRSSEVFDALDRQNDKNSANEQPQDAKFAGRLLNVERDLLTVWATSAVEEALASLEKRKGENGKSGSNATENSEQRQPLTASSGLLAALSLLSSRCQIVGLGRRSEDVWLRKEALRRFNDGWLRRQASNQDGEQCLLDCELLIAISSDASDTTISRPLESFRKRIVSSSASLQTWQQRTSADLPQALSRLRLTVGRLVLNEESFANMLAGGGSTKTSTASRSAVTSAPPPLPLLRLVHHQSKIPRIPMASKLELK